MYCKEDLAELTLEKDVFGPDTAAWICNECGLLQVDWENAKKLFASLGENFRDIKEVAGRYPEKPGESDQELAFCGCLEIIVIIR